MRSRIAQPLLSFVLLGVVAGCEIGLPAGGTPHRELNFLDMADQPKLKPQRGDLLGETANGMLAPPPGSIAVGQHPYRFSASQPELAGRSSENPLKPMPSVLSHGAFIWDNVCITCHGAEGAGDGHLTRVFPAPPSLLTQRVRDWPDGRIFHVVMRGQGSMPSHAKQLESRDIWSVVHHVRQMQAKLPVAPGAESTTSTAATGGTQ